MVGALMNMIYDNNPFNRTHQGASYRKSRCFAALHASYKTPLIAVIIFICSTLCISFVTYIAVILNIMLIERDVLPNFNLNGNKIDGGILNFIFEVIAFCVFSLVGMGIFYVLRTSYTIYKNEMEKFDLEMVEWRK